jgi:L-ascorbate metabolism protein UlaG (beta-lactamase superfamily)
MCAVYDPTVPRISFAEDIRFRVSYDDATAFGSPTTTKPDEKVRAIFSPVTEYIQSEGWSHLIKESPTLLKRCVDSDPFRQICDLRDGESWRIRPEILFPDATRSKPARLSIYREDLETGVELGLSPRDWIVAHGVISHLAGTGTERINLHDRSSVELLSMFEREGLTTSISADQNIKGVGSTDAQVTFVGHNCVVVRSSAASLIIDPFFFPRSRLNPASYQPVLRRDLGHIAAILITHSHPDHFDPASLLQFPCDTPIFLPEISCARENLLSIDMPMRLKELGFTDCRILKWNTSERIADLAVHALPFYGEQPSDSDVLHPEVRNSGNTYVIVTPHLSAAFVADSGRDCRGDVKQVASDWRLRHGPIDLLFSGYRGWVTYPVQLLFSSVSRYLLFVPPHLWGTRLQLMTNIADAIDLAERWGARYLVPYGDGGGPWHWRIGLGPQLDGSGTEDPAFDPFPERVCQETQLRVKLPGGVSGMSPVHTLLMHPGESIDTTSESFRIVRHARHEWPYLK